ncbi:glycosyltransferase family 4 protein [Blastococcus goldschmidtiae]|uniref:Glycosyltransferase family 4 protein n=1 Tax=Blastococcus goldschmidtiae TaxID=3075546 RepID=A0ABU2K682_9ACTN|nr:glycosyltransferase family 4 protein [Blastococcus sp. DSM 46792]MDT0275708.1 glycosyltransferase family 4 protein [Blastococcus sp. DSM 46792]
MTRRGDVVADAPTGTVLVAHPSADLYGSDLQLLESISGLVTRGWRVVVTLPHEGPLTPRLRACGAEVGFLPVPVLRKSLLSPAGLLSLVWSSLRALGPMLQQLRRDAPDAVYVNTVTVPLWLIAARLARRPALCHVHEAEEARTLVRVVLNLPLFLARAVVVNSQAAADTVLSALPGLARRVQVVHNGVPGPATEPGAISTSGRRRIALVGRLSPRKGIDVALEAVALVAAGGHDVSLQLCGSVFPGYEWYEAELRERAARPDLTGRVTFAGYTSPTWPALDRAEVVLVPSRAEPFGNAAVEGQLAARPVVASAVQGLREIVTDGENGLLVPPDDPPALATALTRLLDDPELALRLASEGRASALRRFSPERYQEDIASAVSAIARR